MNTPSRLAAFGAGLGVVFAGALGAGRTVGPIGAAAERHAPSGTTQYRLRVHGSAPRAGTAGALSFDIAGPDGVLRAFETSHERELHLIVVRRDLRSFQHVHPTRNDAGVWTVPLTLPQPGPYRVFADFVPAGAERSSVVHTDVTVPGEYVATPLGPATSTTAAGGYAVRLDGALVPGQTSALTLHVSDSSGVPVDDLEPYLGAYGHLVALRASDLAYLHVHPDGSPGDGRTVPGPGITFHVEVPSDGAYGLFLDFKHQGQVRTAAFTVDTVAAAAGATHSGHSR